MTPDERTARIIEGRTPGIVAAARALVAEPNNMDVRRAYLQATFNLDHTALVIASLADSKAGTSVQSARPREDKNPNSQGTNTTS
jgi:hypothetical protein